MTEGVLKIKSKDRNIKNQVTSKTKGHNTFRSFIWIIAGLIGLYMIWAYIERSPFPLQEKAPIVSVVKVVRSNLAEEIALSAELVPYQKAILYAKVSGYLKTINVDIGDQVKTNEILAQLEVPELKDDLANRKAQHDIAKLVYDRIKAVPVDHPGLIAQEDIDKAKADLEMAQASYEHAKTLISFATIIAPYDGIITKRFVDEGALIQVGTSSSTQAQPVVEVAENTKLRLVFPVPEANVTAVKVGNQAQITIQSTGEKLTGKIARMADQVDFNTRTMRTEIDIDNTSLTMKPGMYAAVKLFLHETNNSLAVPTQAVDLLSNSPNVWVVNEKGKVEKRPVTIGVKTPDQIGIMSGVKEGEIVVFGNRDLIKEGMMVIPKLISTANFKTG
jgi:RND family efflux transporter MFP subunit